MSTLTDLFSMRIGAGRRGVFIENLGDEYTVLFADERVPSREKIEVKFFNKKPLEDILIHEGISRENLYYILPPYRYYKNILGFPFQDRQKIELIIKNEVRDQLPDPEREYLTDFYPLGRFSLSDSNSRPISPEKGPSTNEVLSFTTEKGVIREIIEGFGVYRENLRGVIPFDLAVFYGVISLLDRETFIFMDVHNSSVYIQLVKGLRPFRGVLIKKNDDNRFRSALLTELLLLIKGSGYPTLFVNTRKNADGDFKRLNSEVLESLNLSFRNLPLKNYGDYFPHDEKTDLSEIISTFGALRLLTQTPQRRVNLLKEEFKPRSKGYVSVKEFVALGIFLILLLSFSMSNLFIDIHLKREQVNELKEGIGNLSSAVFQKPQMEWKEAKKLLDDTQEKLNQGIKAVDRSFSGAQLLKELSSSLPPEVAIEYTEIIIESDRIKFSGKTMTFSDTDKIREALLKSEYFSNVSITNTGTTGSGEGFAVTFLFDIEVIKE